MADWVYDQGHIGWTLFDSLVYTGVLLLVADYVWRCVTIPSRTLLAGIAALWIAGLLGIGLSF